MRIGLYKNEYGIREYYREFPCCEINIDEMTAGTDYTLYINGSTQTIHGIDVTVKHFTIKTAGCAKIVNPITRDNELIMQPPFWEMNENTGLREWMGGHFTAQTFENEPPDWNTALYWKYYTYTADTKFAQWKAPPTTYNAGTTYYTCDSEEFEPQKIYYANGNYAASFVIGQCLYNPPWSTGTSLGIPEHDIAGATYNGYSCGSSLTGPANGIARTRWFAIKAPNEEFTGYANMHPYTYSAGTYLHEFPDEILASSPPENQRYKHHWQLAHIIYNGNEYIGWGEIKYNREHPDQMQSADFSCSNIELFQDAIVPDAEPYENGTPAGNPSGMGGMGSGLPDGDDFGASASGGSLMPLGGGLHAYQVTNTDLNALMGYLWGGGFASGGLWEKFKNYKFNPIAGILSVHHIPYELQPTVGTNGYVQLAGLTFNGVDSGGTSISVPVIAAENHVSHFSIDPVYLDHEHGELPYFSFEDYARTRVRVYLPYCGIVELDPASCIGGCIEIEYQCDVINGNVGVQIVTASKPDRNGHQRRHVSAVATGNCAYKIAMTGNDNGTGEILGAIQGAAGAMLSGNFMGALGAGLKAISGTEQHHTFTTGSISGNAGFLTSRSVIVEVTYGDYYKTDGEYPAMMMRPAASSGIVSDFTGHCQCIVHANAITAATDAERLEIEQACKTGIIV